MRYEIILSDCSLLQMFSFNDAYSSIRTVINQYKDEPKFTNSSTLHTEQALCTWVIDRKLETEHLTQINSIIHGVSLKQCDQGVKQYSESKYFTYVKAEAMRPLDNFKKYSYVLRLNEKI